MITASLTTDNTNVMDLTSKLNDFFITHEKKAFSIAFISLKNHDDALDVVQDVMVKFVEKYKHKKCDTWTSIFYRMIQNRITDFHRKNTQQKKYFKLFYLEDSNEIDEIKDVNYTSSLKQIEQNMQIEHLQSALQNLPTRQLQAYICRIWEGLSVKETAKSMKCSQGSVKTHLFRALKQLKNEMNLENEVEQ